MLVFKKLPLFLIDKAACVWAMMFVIVLSAYELLHIINCRSCQKIKMRSMTETALAQIKRILDAV